MTERDVARLGDLLAPVGKKLRLEGPAATGQLWRRWHAIVGPEVARHAEPTSLKEGVLRVRTTSPVWATEISYLAEDIRERVNDALGKSVVREIKVWTSPGPIAPPRDEKSRESATDRGGRRGREDDPQNAFQKAFEAWSKRRRRGTR